MEGFTKKHLVDGDAEPKFDPKKVSIINMRFCPYGQRAALVLLAKDIP